MIYTDPTFRELTAPGYFDFSSGQTAKTAAMVAWFDAVMARWGAQVNLFDETFRLWATRDYSAVTVSMTPWLLRLLNENGIGWFGGTIEQSVALLTYISKSYPSSIAMCFQELFEFLAAAPLQWMTGAGTIEIGLDLPARFAETLIIYSTSGTPPATPAATVYTALEWTAPTGWDKTASSATYYSRGYLSGGNIVWMTPRATSAVSMMQDVADLGSLPGSPSAGDLCGVADDGTGDVGAIYYYDGAAWRKTTTPNVNQGEVIYEVAPDPGSTVFAENGYVSSTIQPSASGPSEGYGYYGIFGEFVIYPRRINIKMDLTTAGVSNLGMIVYLFRKIKPTLNQLVLLYTTPTNPDYTFIDVKDIGAVS